jgi:hypothetical protein
LIGIDEFEKQANTHALRQAITHILLLQRLKLLLQCLLHDRSNKCQTPINQNLNYNYYYYYYYKNNNDHSSNTTRQAGTYQLIHVEARTGAMVVGQCL